MAPAPRITFGAVPGSTRVARLLGGVLTSRLPGGMAPMAIALRTLTTGSSIAFGGLLSTLYGLASGLSQPTQGRRMDRYGQTAVHQSAALAVLLLPRPGHTPAGHGRHRVPRPGRIAPFRAALPLNSPSTKPISRGFSYGCPYALEHYARLWPRDCP